MLTGKDLVLVAIVAGLSNYLGNKLKNYLINHKKNPKKGEIDGN